MSDAPPVADEGSVAAPGLATEAIPGVHVDAASASASHSQRDLPPCTDGEVLRAWWPLCTSWLLMSIEQPATAAVIARLGDAQTHLAAWGGVVFAIALVIESPVIMMLAASTELVRDRASYQRLRRFTHRAGFALTSFHLLLVATPLFDLVVGRAMAVPPDIMAPARIGLACALPWSWAIAWRRFNQGILIRFGHSRTVGLGTAVRLSTNTIVLVTGWWFDAPGAPLGACALASGAVAEALWIARRTQPVILEHLQLDRGRPPLVGRAFMRFYLPLAMTPLVTLAVAPFGTAAVARMPEVMPSLAVWPVVNALMFVMAAPGLALHEVVVAYWHRRGGPDVLARLVRRMTLVVTTIALLLAATPLGDLWFTVIGGLPDALAGLATVALWIVVASPGSRVLQSWYQGGLVAQRRTIAVSASVVVFAILTLASLVAVVRWGPWAGLHAALGAFMLGRVAQTVVLAWGARRSARRSA